MRRAVCLLSCGDGFSYSKISEGGTISLPFTPGHPAPSLCHHCIIDIMEGLAPSSSPTDTTR